MKLYAICMYDENLSNGKYRICYAGKNYTPAIYDKEYSAKRVMKIKNADVLLEVDLENGKKVSENKK